MEIQLLRDPEIFPSGGVLASALGDSYGAYKAFSEKLPDCGVETEWRYYNDGKAWLGKCVHKKKTVFWLSVWDGFFKTTMFFTEKTKEGIEGLPIREDIKTKFAEAGNVGKLIPLLLEIRSEADLDDAFTLISYKKGLK